MKIITLAITAIVLVSFSESAHARRYYQEASTSEIIGGAAAGCGAGALVVGAIGAAATHSVGAAVVGGSVGCVVTGAFVGGMTAATAAEAPSENEIQAEQPAQDDSASE